MTIYTWTITEEIIYNQHKSLTSLIHTWAMGYGLIQDSYKSPNSLLQDSYSLLQVFYKSLTHLLIIHWVGVVG